MRNYQKTQTSFFVITQKIKVFLTIGLITCGLGLQSCQNGENPNGDLAEVGLDLAGLDFGGNLDFVNKPFLISGSTEKNLQVNIDEALEELVKNLDAAEISEYRFQIRRLSKQFELIILNISDKNDKPSFGNAKSLTCPEGMTKYVTCMLETCVRNGINTLATNMQNGDSFSVHRRLMSVTICANPRLVEAVE